MCFWGISLGFCDVFFVSVVSFVVFLWIFVLSSEVLLWNFVLSFVVSCRSFTGNVKLKGLIVSGEDGETHPSLMRL